LDCNPQKGEQFNSWFVLLSGSVFTQGSMFLPPATFGQQGPGATKRQNQCYTLEASDLLVVDYDHGSVTSGKRSFGFFIITTFSAGQWAN